MLKVILISFQHIGIYSLRRLESVQGTVFKIFSHIKNLEELGYSYIQSRWVSQIAYIDEQAKVEIIFAPAIIPLITRLERIYKVRHTTGFWIHQAVMQQGFMSY